MAGYNAPALNPLIMEAVLEAAKGLGKEIFTANEVVYRVHGSLPNLPATTIRTYLLAMSSPNRKERYFDFLGNESYRLITPNIKAPQPTPKVTVPPIIPPTTPPPAPAVASPVTPPPIIQRKPQPEPPIPQSYPTETVAVPKTDKKDVFLQKYTSYITAWTRQNKTALIAARQNYRWRGATVGQSLDQRNQLSKQIVLSRIKNNGAIDRQTLDSIMAWGFPNPLFPERDQEACLRVTREAFALLDDGKVAEATLKLMSIDGVGISRASKIIGLSDQNSLAVYDSRVGAALETLTNDGHKIIKSPSGVNRAGDLDCSPIDWAENYQKLIWVLEVIRNELNEEGYPFNIADVEMALSVMGN